jgi:ribosomal protein L24E
MDQGNDADDDSLTCARCGAELTPGKGDFYVVRIEAVADPSPPCFSDDDLRRDPRAEIERLIQQMGHLSEQELLDQVYRRLTVYLCGPCYRQWIEDPIR